MIATLIKDPNSVLNILALVVVAVCIIFMWVTRPNKEERDELKKKLDESKSKK